MPEPFITYKGFKGINNLKNEWELNPGELLEAENVDINEANKLVRRSGYVKRINGNFSSLYADSYICLAVLDNSLVRIHSNLNTVETLRSNVGSSAMSYVRVNDIVVYSNGNVIGYVKNGTSYTFPDPTEEFKLPIPSGNLIEYYNGRLYTIMGKIFFWSDVLATDFAWIDKRENGKQMSSNIMLFKAVDDGVFISDENRIYFARGLDAKEWNQPGGLREVLDYPAKYDAWCEVDGDFLGFREPLSGKVYAITTEKGVCIISNSGFITNITEKYYEMLQGQKIAMLFRQRNNLNQVITAITN